MGESVYANMVGKRYGRLVILRLGGRDSHYNQLCLCRCDCGREKEMYADGLKKGRITSCGCYRTEVINGSRKCFQESERVGGTFRYMLSTQSYKNNKSGRRGVFYDKKRNKWKVSISVNGQQIYLGYYRSYDEAVRVREEAEEVYWKPVLIK